MDDSTSDVGRARGFLDLGTSSCSAAEASTELGPAGEDASAAVFEISVMVASSKDVAVSMGWFGEDAGERRRANLFAEEAVGEGCGDRDGDGFSFSKARSLALATELPTTPVLIAENDFFAGVDGSFSVLEDVSITVTAPNPSSSSLSSE